MLCFSSRVNRAADKYLECPLDFFKYHLVHSDSDSGESLDTLSESEIGALKGGAVVPLRGICPWYGKLFS